jgi:hypothetical protein
MATFSKEKQQNSLITHTTDPEVYYYTSGMLNGLHETIGMVNGTLNGLHRMIGTVNGMLNGLYGTIGTENRTLNGLHGMIGTLNGTLNGLHRTIRTETVGTLSKFTFRKLSLFIIVIITIYTLRHLFFE